jgi:rhamnulokinase
MPSTTFAAIDLGADSGRVLLGTLSEGKLSLEEAHRFSNGAVFVNGGWRWDVLGLFKEMKEGLRKAAADGHRISSLSVDSWGVDYALLRGNLPHLAPPYQYRDARNAESSRRVRAELGDELIYEHTGIQFLDFNTIYQLAADVRDPAGLLPLADGFLTIGDYFNWLFCGRRVIERSLASTTQLYDPRTHEWSDTLIKAAGLPRELFPPLVDAGTVLGTVLPDLAAELGLDPGTQVVATCSHDTGAAVAGAPLSGPDAAYLSSGTWSLLGVELRDPVLSQEARLAGFSNEVGIERTIRFLKNIIGMWILQECKRDWARQGRDYEYADLVAQAAAAPARRTFIHPNDARFLAAGNMPEKVRGYCAETGQPVPDSPGEIVRCVLDSLALLYATFLDELEGVTGQPIGVLHIVGGGSRNELLNQSTADASGRRVVAGPVEATAIGNLLAQAVALGLAADLGEIRAIVRGSFPVREFSPADPSVWGPARELFQSLSARAD